MNSVLLSILTAMPMVMAIAFIVCHNFPWIYRFKKIKIHSMFLDGSIVIVSDIHIGSKNSYYFLLKEFLKRINYDVVIVAGDFIDKRIEFNKNTIDYLRAAIKALDIRRGKIIYIASTASHDIDRYFEDIMPLSIDGVETYIVSGVVEIKLGGCRNSVYVSHGEYISRDGVAAYILDKIFNKLFKRNITALLMRRALGVDEYQWVFTGHSHILSIDPIYRIANTGSWDERLYAKAYPGIGIVRCIDGKLYVRLVKLSIR
uniref:Metallophosphoesterase n=1 Tax=Ignisphaera aggregans TaxID=334771 RepID=A0A7C5XQL8_9CREN